MSSYCAISPTSSAPWLRRRATTSSMSSTANMMRRMPSVFAGALSGSALTAGGLWNFVSSSRLWPSGVRIMAMSARTSLSPTTRSTQRPSDRRLAFQLHTEFGEERFGSLEVVDNDENVVHPLNRHFPEHRVGMLRHLPRAIPVCYRFGMSKQIAVRLPDELVDFVDTIV